MTHGLEGVGGGKCPGLCGVGLCIFTPSLLTPISLPKKYPESHHPLQGRVSISKKYHDGYRQWAKSRLTETDMLLALTPESRSSSGNVCFVNGFGCAASSQASVHDPCAPTTSRCALRKKIEPLDCADENDGQLVKLESIAKINSCETVIAVATEGPHMASFPRNP